MPSINNLLIRTEKLDPAEQVKLVEARKQKIVRLMKSFSTREFGYHACIPNYSEGDSDEVPLKTLYEKEGRLVFLGCNSPHDLLRLHGIFTSHNIARYLTLIVGVDRDGDWIFLEINYLDPQNITVTRNKHVSIDNIKQEKNVDLRDIYLHLGIIIEDWVSDRKRLYEEALKVSEGTALETQIFGMLARS